MIVLQL